MALDRPTLREIKDLALDLADVTDSDFISESVLTSWVNFELAKLYDLMVATDQNYFTTSTTLNVDDMGRAQLPADFYRVIRALWQRHDAADGAVAMRRMSSAEWADSRGPHAHAYANSSRCAPSYDIEDGATMVLSVRNSTGRVQLRYVPRMLRLAADTDQLNLAIEPSYIDLVVLNVAKRCRIKEESDTSDLRADIAAAEARVVNMATDRDVGEPHQVRDIYPRDIYSRGWF